LVLPGHLLRDPRRSRGCVYTDCQMENRERRRARSDYDVGRLPQLFVTS
jgi:hypothetical protein